MDITDPYSRNLGRGQACGACRRRKIRCDGGKPSCNRCVEARNRKLEAMQKKGKTEEEIKAVRFPPCYSDQDENESFNDETTPSKIGSKTTNSAEERSNIAGPSNASTVGSSSDQRSLPFNAPSASSTDRSVFNDPLTPEDGRPNKIQRTTGVNGGEGLLTSSSRNPVHQSNKQDTNQSDLFFAEILSSHLPLDASRSSSGDGFGNGSTDPGQSQHQQQQQQSGQFSFLGNDENMPSLDPPKAIVPPAHADSVATAYWLHDSEVALPNQPLLNQLIDVFFEDHDCSYIFHPGRLRERIALGPDHDNYPQNAALHIIVALAYASRPEIDEEVSGGRKPTERSGAHYRHFAAASQSLFHSFHCDKLKTPLDLVRASLLLVSKLYGQGDQLESYLASAQAARLCVSLNLNRDVPSRAEQQLQQLQYLLMQPRITDNSIIRPEPSDAIEAEELRRTMLLMFAIDRTTIAATLWPSALVEEDYTAELPRATFQEFISTTTNNIHTQEWVNRRNTLSIHSHDFFSRRTMDAEQFFFKLTVLLGRCAQYVSRLSRTATPTQIVSAPRFQQLENWIAAMHLESYEVANQSLKGEKTSSSPASWSTRKADSSALTAYLLNSTANSAISKNLIVTPALLPYACTLTLHEPLASLSSESEERCKAATRGAINVLRLCALHAQDDMQRLDVVMTIVVMLVGRSLIRQLESLYSKYIAQELAQQGENGDGLPKTESVWNSDEFTESVSLLQADLEVVLLTLKRYGQKWVIAIKMHDSLLKLLQFNPEHRLRGLFCVE